MCWRRMWRRNLFFLDADVSFSGYGGSSVAMAWSGTHVLLVYQTAYDTDGPNERDIYIQRLDGSGSYQNINGPSELNSDSDNSGNDADDKSPSVACGLSACVAAWGAYGNVDTTGSDWDIVYRTTSNHGSTWALSTALHSSMKSDCTADEDPDLVAVDDGATTLFIAAWTSKATSDSNGNTGEGSDRDIFFSSTVNHASSWWAPLISLLGPELRALPLKLQRSLSRVQFTLLSFQFGLDQVLGLTFLTTGVLHSILSLWRPTRLVPPSPFLQMDPRLFGAQTTNAGRRRIKGIHGLFTHCHFLSLMWRLTSSTTSGVLHSKMQSTTLVGIVMFSPGQQRT